MTHVHFSKTSLSILGEGSSKEDDGATIYIEVILWSESSPAHHRDRGMFVGGGMRRWKSSSSFGSENQPLPVSSGWAASADQWERAAGRPPGDWASVWADTAERTLLLSRLVSVVACTHTYVLGLNTGTLCKANSSVCSSLIA